MKDYEIKEFKTEKQWRQWLKNNHEKVDGIWLRVYKKDSEIKTVSRSEALDNALCYGWIDGQAKKYDDVSYLQKYTPRRNNSMWSKINVEHVQRLTKAGLMRPAGLNKVTKAKKDGRWTRAYASPKNMVMPIDFTAAVKKNKKISENFNKLSKGELYNIYFQLQTARTMDVRTRRFNKLIKKLEDGELIQ